MNQIVTMNDSSCHVMVVDYFLYSDLDFGFVQLSVTVPESIGRVVLSATLLSGQIADGLTIIIRASTDDSSSATTATGM